MADRWIVSSYEFHQHESLEVATREAARLAEKTGKVMHVHRVKTTLLRSDAMAVIERLNARVKELEAIYETDMRPTFVPPNTVKVGCDCFPDGFIIREGAPDTCACFPRGYPNP